MNFHGYYHVSLRHHCVIIQQEGKKFSPEAEFLSAVKAIPGVSQVETQTYTLMPVSL